MQLTGLSEMENYFRYTFLKTIAIIKDLQSFNDDDYEKQLKKGDNIILAAFGAGFTWGSVYLKWAYNS